MSLLTRFTRRQTLGFGVAALVTASLAQLATGGAILTNQRQVGGVSIDTQGVLDNVDPRDREELKLAREKALHEVPGDLKKPSKMRMVSLRRLEETIAKHLKNPAPLPDDIVCLAGLQKIQYVFVYPEQKDIVLAGPAEGWKIGETGEIVGETTGKPVMLLDDLLVALRTAESSRRVGISCSIDPTPEGITRLKAFLAKQATIGNPQATIAEIERALGPQMITVTGVPGTSHFARVMVGADYRMKRLAMSFDKAPIRGLPSFMDMLAAGPKGQAMLPRWWLAPNYDPLMKDPDGLAWELSGAGVKAMTEEDFVDGAGKRVRTVKGTGIAQKWADNMTNKYEELSTKDGVFGQLRNCMDLAIVSALIAKERLAEKAGWKMSLLVDAKELVLDEFNVPTRVSSKAKALKKGSNWLISASGGVQLNSWEIADNTKETTSLAPVREQAGSGKGTWWWD